MRNFILVTAALLSSGFSAAAEEPFMAPGTANNPDVAVALGYIQTVWNDHKPVEGYAKYYAPNGIHHPGKPGNGNPEGLAKFLKGFPDFQYHIKQVFADGDYVILHSFVTGGPGAGRPVASPQPGMEPQPKTGDEVVDIFLIKNGKITDQWDTVEEIGGTTDSLF